MNEQNLEGEMVKTYDKPMDWLSKAAPDWLPAQTAVGVADGIRAHGSTGQLFEAKNGRWERVPITEETCPGHVAAQDDEKVCGRCGTHIDSLRPDDEGK